MKVSGSGRQSTYIHYIEFLVIPGGGTGDPAGLVGNVNADIDRPAISTWPSVILLADTRNVSCFYFFVKKNLKADSS